MQRGTFPGGGGVGGGQRRGPGIPPMVPGAGPSAQQIAAQQQASAAAAQEAMKRREEAKNRSLKPVDRDLPEGIDELVVGDGVERYNRMREAERKLDALIMRKRLDISDSVYHETKNYRKMRIWISNTVQNQPWQFTGMDSSAYDFNSGIEATYRVTIQGRLLDDDADADDGDGLDQDDKAATAADEAAAAEVPAEEERAAKRTKLSSPPAPPRKKLSHFFKSITIDYDRLANLQPDGFTRIEWKRPDIQPVPNMELPQEADFDKLDFERKGDVNMNITISMVRDEYPERYRLAKPLADLLDVDEADRQTVLMGIWEYIKLAGVRTDEDKRQIYCDHALQAIFKTEVLYFPTLRDAIRPLLYDLAPLQLKYTIRTDKAFHTGGPQPEYTIYDVPVHVSSPLTNQIKAINRDPAHIENLHKIAQMDDDIALLVQKMKQSKARHDFFTSMSKDPARFIKRWTESQKRDLDIVLGAGSWREEDWQGAEWRKGGQEGVWGSDEAYEAVASFLARKVS